MAQFINFNIVGGFAVGSGADPSLDGDNLVAVSDILSVKAEIGGSSEFNVIVQLKGGLNARVTCGTGALGTDDPTNAANQPTAANYLALMKKAVNRAITANPGGVKASVILPQDSDDPNAKYDQALRVYWKDILIS